MPRIRRLPVLLVAALVLLALAASSGGSHLVRGHSRTGPASFFDPRKEALFEGRGGLGGEAHRGADNPAAEQVANRAYPRGYVDDRIARQGGKPFDAISHRPTRNSFSTQGTFHA